MLRTFNRQNIDSVLKHDDIWPKISYATQDRETYTAPLGSNHYLFEEGVLYILHPKGDDWQIHANVLPEHRHKAFAAGQEALAYAFNVIGAERVIAIIPTDCGNVYGFTLKSGMKDMGIIEGEHFLALRREQWDS